MTPRFLEEEFSLQSARRTVMVVFCLALLAAIIAGTLWLTTEGQQRAFERQSQEIVKGYSQRLAARVQDSCQNVLLAEQASCVTKEADKTRERVRRELEVQAQLVTSAWTRTMGIAALIAMGVGILGAGLIFTTFRETKRAADEARRSANAFIDAERGRLLITSHGGTTATPPIQIHVNIAAINYGGSTVVVDRICWAVLDSTRYPAHNFIAGEVRWRDLKTIIKANEEESALASIHVPAEAPYVGGYVEYSTRFSLTERAHFLFTMRPVPRNDLVISTYDQLVQDAERSFWPDDT